MPRWKVPAEPILRFVDIEAEKVGSQDEEGDEDDAAYLLLKKYAIF